MAFMFLFISLDAQYYLLPPVQNGKNPGDLNKDAELPQNGGLTAGWMTILQGPQASGNWSATFQVPFKFYFNGALVRNYKASTSGVLTFNTRTSLRVDSNNIALPTSRIPDSSICIWGLRALQGDYIVIRTFGKEPHRQLWISYNSFSEHNLKSGGHIYVSIVLEETTNKIFLVDQRTVCRQNNVDCTDKTNLTLGIQIDSTLAYMVPGSPDYSSENQNLPTTEDNVYYEFIPGQQPDLDVERQSQQFKDYYLFREFPIDLVGRFKNIGKNPIQKLSYHYQVGNGPVFDAQISGLNIAPLEEFTLTHPTALQNTFTGFALVNVRSWIGQINDQPAILPSDDTLSSQFIVNDTFFNRVLMHEYFASPTSMQSRSGYDTISKIFNQNLGLFALLRYPMASPQGGDPYHTIEAASRGRYYNIGNNAIPSLVIDGATGNSALSYTDESFLSLQSIPSFFQVLPKGSVKGQQIEVEVEIKGEAPINSASKLFVAISEKQSTKNMKSNGETVFYHVLKKFLPDTAGFVIPKIQGDTNIIYNFSWLVPGNYRLPIDGRTANMINLETEHCIEDFSNLEVIAWIQENDKNILQAGSSDLSYTVSTGDERLDEPFLVYPNPAKNELIVVLQNMNVGHPLELVVTDTQGRPVLRESLQNDVTRIQTNEWPNGFYVLMAKGVQGNFMDKVLIAR